MYILIIIIIFFNVLLQYTCYYNAAFCYTDWFSVAISIYLLFTFYLQCSDTVCTTWFCITHKLTTLKLPACYYTHRKSDFAVGGLIRWERKKKHFLDANGQQAIMTTRIMRMKNRGKGDLRRAWGGGGISSASWAFSTLSFSINMSYGCCFTSLETSNWNQLTKSPWIKKQ